jgi:cytochrome d ubiquinol oxidase subunit II
MPLEAAAAGVALLATIAYALFAGADFGGGVWDLLASGPRKREQRRAIERAMAPVWEANHVWLVFLIVILFTCFPRAFSALGVGLFVPFHLALVGITLRGAAFVFRAYGPRTGIHSERWGAVFGASSVVTPFLLGVSMASVSTGRFPDYVSPFTIAVGALALAICAYLASVYLAYETAGDLREDFRRRALVVGGFVVALSAIALPLAREAPHIVGALLGARALPVLVAGAAAALLSGWAILARRWSLSRVAAGAQVTLLLLGWGLAQYPYIVFPRYTIHDAAASPVMLRFLLWTIPPGAALLVPSLWLLLRVFKKTRAPE